MEIYDTPYSIRLSAADKVCLRELAHQLQRSQAGTLRLLLHETFKAFLDIPTDTPSYPDREPEQVTDH
jgi:hypothetical protein